MTSAGSTSSTTSSGGFSALEELDLTVATPVATAHLSWGETSAAAFDAPNNCWCVQPSGSIQIKLNLPDLQGVTFILEPNMQPVAGIPKYPVTITVNDESFAVEFDPHSDPRTMVQSWYLSSTMLTTGDNLISVKSSSTTPLYLQAAYVMVFDMQEQLQSEWCWAAVTASLSNFLTPENPLSQCQVVNSVLKQSNGGAATVDCCQNGIDPACNQANSLSSALQLDGSLQCFHPFHLPPDLIRSLINRGKPLPILINWRQSNGAFGGGHYVAITGVGPDDPKGQGATMVAVEDPLNGPCFLPFDVLAKQYKGDGFWMYSYVLK